MTQKNTTRGLIPPSARIAGGSPATPAVATRQRCGRGGRESGFTLVEVVVAMTLLLLALTTFVVSFVQSKRSAAIAENRLEAIHTARDKMETIASYLYTATGLSIGTHNFANGFYTVSNNTIANVKDITLTVRWVNPVGKITSTVSLAGSVSSNLHQ